MRQYILNLTDNLIGRNNYKEVFSKIRSQEEFIDFVKMDQYCGEVRKMNPETLGKIMCAFDIGDVMATRQDLFNGVNFSGDCEEFLRELVSLCLAYAIRERLNVKETPKA